MNVVRRVLMALAAVLMLAFTLVVVIGLAGTSPGALALFTLFAGIALGAILWAVFGKGVRRKSHFKEEVPLNVAD